MPFQKGHKLGAKKRLDRNLGKEAIAFKGYEGQKEKLSDVPDWQEKFRQFVDDLIVGTTSTSEKAITAQYAYVEYLVPSNNDSEPGSSYLVPELIVELLDEEIAFLCHRHERECELIQKHVEEEVEKLSEKKYHDVLRENYQLRCELEELKKKVSKKTLSKNQSKF